MAASVEEEQACDCEGTHLIAPFILTEPSGCCKNVSAALVLMACGGCNNRGRVSDGGVDGDDGGIFCDIEPTKKKVI